MRILVIDYDESIRSFLEVGLRRFGYEVKTLPRNHEVPLHFDLRGIDALLLDARTPAIDGIGYARIARDQGFLGMIAIASGLFPQNARAMGQPFDYYLAKPFSLTEIHRLLQGDPSYCTSLPIGDRDFRKVEPFVRLPTVAVCS